MQETANPFDEPLKILDELLPRLKPGQAAACRLLTEHMRGHAMPVRRSLREVARRAGVDETMVKEMRMALVVLGVLPKLGGNYDETRIRQIWETLEKDKKARLEDVAQTHGWQKKDVLFAARIGRMVGTVSLRIDHFGKEVIGEVLQAVKQDKITPSKAGEEICGAKKSTAMNWARKNGLSQKERIAERRTKLLELINKKGMTSEQAAAYLNVGTRTVDSDRRYLREKDLLVSPGF